MVYGIPVLIFSVLFNLPRFYETDLCAVSCPIVNETIQLDKCKIKVDEDYGDNVTVNSEEAYEYCCKIVSTPLRDNPDYIKFYINISNFIVHALIPFMALIGMNIMIYKEVRITTQVLLNIIWGAELE